MSTIARPLHDLHNQKPERDEILWMWLGQGSFAYRFGSGVTIVVDPYLSDIVERQEGLTRTFPHAVKPEEIVGDWVLITHDHLDHYDPDTVPFAANYGIPILGPHSCHLHYLEQGLPMPLFQTVEVGETYQMSEIKVTIVPAHHPSGHNMWDSVGFLFEYRGKTIYHVGDSELTDWILSTTKNLQPDLLVVPINGRWGNMNANEAARLAAATKAKRVIPMHFGMFAENTADPNTFIEAAKIQDLPCDIRIPQGFVIEKL